MLNLSDNDLDNLFNKAASESEPEFDPADWKDLAQRLASPTPVPQAPVFSPILKAASIAVVTGSLVWLSLVIHQNSQDKPLAPSDISVSTSSTESGDQQKSNELPPSSTTAATKDSASTVHLEKYPATALSKDRQSKESTAEKNEEKLSTEQQQKTLSTKKANHENTDGRANQTRHPRNVGNANTPEKSIETKHEVRPQDIATVTEQREDPLPEKINLNDANDGTNQALHTENAGKSNIQTESIGGDSQGVPISTEQHEDPFTKKERADNKDDKPGSPLNAGNVSLPGATAKTVEGTVGTQGKEMVNSTALPPDQQRVNTAEKLLLTTTPQQDKAEYSITPGTPHEGGAASKVATQVTNLDSVKQPLPLDKADPLPTTTEPKDSTNKERTFSRLVLKASITPDFSSDGFQKTDKVGLNYGAQVEYFFTQHLSVSAGVIWSRKYYSASDIEYLFLKIGEVKADCRMWDIPVNVSYYATPSKQYSAFISAGFSSYLMSSETYTFELTTIYDGTHQYSMQVKNGNNEWFKVMNISVGLQGKLTPHLSFQVEPFLKVPLAEIGAGKVALSSFGSYFSLLYRFSKKHN